MTKRTVTVKSVSDDDLQGLQNSAGAAGDIIMAAIAELARTGKFDGDEWTALEPHEVRRVNKMTKRQALKECVDVINAARRESEREWE